jgi:hypothetical protein
MEQLQSALSEHLISKSGHLQARSIVLSGCNIGKIFVLIIYFVECFQHLMKYGAERLVVNNFFSGFE